MGKRWLYAFISLTISFVALLVVLNKQNSVSVQKENTLNRGIIHIETILMDAVETIRAENTETVVQGYPVISLSESDIDLLLRIGTCEAGSESVECIANVMRTVLNRVEDDAFPNSVYGVLYQKNQFTPVETGWINTVCPVDKSYEAIEMIKFGWDDSKGALYFESCKGESWHSRNLEFLFQCDAMRFYK